MYGLFNNSIAEFKYKKKPTFMISLFFVLSWVVHENKNWSGYRCGILPKPTVPEVSVVATNNTTQLVIVIIGNIHGQFTQQKAIRHLMK